MSVESKVKDSLETVADGTDVEPELGQFSAYLRRPYRCGRSRWGPRRPW